MLYEKKQEISSEKQQLKGSTNLCIKTWSLVFHDMHSQVLNTRQSTLIDF